MLERCSEELVAIRLYGNPGLIKTHIQNHVRVNTDKLTSDLNFLVSYGHVIYDETNKTYTLTPQGRDTADYYSKWRKIIVPKIEIESI